MGTHASKPAFAHPIVIPSGIPFDSTESPFSQKIVHSSYFRDVYVTRLKTLIVQKERIIGVLLPNNMNSMLIFTLRQDKKKKRCILKFRQKVARWPFQGIFFPIGEIALGIQDVKSGSWIHGLRTACLQEGQKVRVAVMKYGTPARLLPAARAMHWAQQHPMNNAVVDMFENIREKDRADTLDRSPIAGTLKIFYIDDEMRYIREASRGPIRGDEMIYNPNKEVTILHPTGRSVFVWFILVCYDGRVFQSRQLRVYSKMFFRNKFGAHANVQEDQEELFASEILKREKEQDELLALSGQSSNLRPQNPHVKHLKEISAVKGRSVRPDEEEKKIDHMTAGSTRARDAAALNLAPSDVAMALDPTDDSDI